ncbi:MAG: WhiB family transcriptional regulator [Actinomycetota bacterium]|nr:WhiB family transcriptional regulator [Actinomycetota bacterium]
MQRGACVDAPDPDIFFPGSGESDEPAKAICAGCPVREPCLRWALEHEEHGTWVGLSPSERKRLKKGAA